MRYCVDQTGAMIDVQAAALDYYHARQVPPSQPTIERQAIAELLGSQGRGVRGEVSESMARLKPGT